jgi:hypothetical protein
MENTVLLQNKNMYIIDNLICMYFITEMPYFKRPSKERYVP